MSTYYEISEPDVVWGDYGRFLFSGMNGNEVGDARFPVKLMRTGPFVPKLSFPWGYFVLHADIGRALETQHFKGVRLADVELAKIVNVNWHEWDQSSNDPERYPAGGEPENYVLRRKHSDAVASQLPKLVALDVPVLQEPPKRTPLEAEGVDPSTDAFEWGWRLYASEKLMGWFKEMVPECISISKPMRLFEK
ncbi:MAG: hypothetical protein HKN11_10235 [Rhizobiales bacterium]|nr:hypothetical protein [Hyphomicrobiales bacterium]